MRVIVRTNNRPYLVYVKCRFHIRFHIGLYIQGLGITDGNSIGWSSDHGDFLQDHALSQLREDILSQFFAVLIKLWNKSTGQNYEQ